MATTDPAVGRTHEATRLHASTPDPDDAASKSPAAPYIVLVGLDLSEPGGRAWRFAFELASTRGEAEIHAVVIGARQLAPPIRDLRTPSALSASPGFGGDAGSARAPPLRVLQHRSVSGQARLMAMHFRTGRADRAIVRLAREIHADLIVVAKHPITRLQRLFGGSIADRIARTAPCPVVVVGPKLGDDEEARLVEPG
jgi:nucleotide-binding universal stress UspA family protein